MARRIPRRATEIHTFTWCGFKAKPRCPGRVIQSFAAKIGCNLVNNQNSLNLVGFITTP